MSLAYYFQSYFFTPRLCSSVSGYLNKSAFVFLASLVTTALQKYLCSNDCQAFYCLFYILFLYLSNRGYHLADHTGSRQLYTDYSAITPRGGNKKHRGRYLAHDIETGDHYVAHTESDGSRDKRPFGQKQFEHTEANRHYSDNDQGQNYEDSPGSLSFYDIKDVLANRNRKPSGQSHYPDGQAASGPFNSGHSENSQYHTEYYDKGENFETEKTRSGLRAAGSGFEKTENPRTQHYYRVDGKQRRPATGNRRGKTSAPPGICCTL
jgi:hypothetical protein